MGTPARRGMGGTGIGIGGILVIVGIVQLFQGQIILGVVLIVAGCLVGPGGYSIFRSRSA